MPVHRGKEVTQIGSQRPVEIQGESGKVRSGYSFSHSHLPNTICQGSDPVPSTAQELRQGQGGRNVGELFGRLLVPRALSPYSCLLSSPGKNKLSSGYPVRSTEPEIWLRRTPQMSFLAYTSQGPGPEALPTQPGSDSFIFFSSISAPNQVE